MKILQSAIVIETTLTLESRRNQLRKPVLNRISTAWITLNLCFALLKPVDLKNEYNFKRVFKCYSE